MSPHARARCLFVFFLLILSLIPTCMSAQAKPPNIVVIFGDDIGYWNIGAYTHGMMGRTPNIDSIAKNGMLFTDHYGQPSCTAGRAAFIMGQMPIRTGMTTIGIPGSTRGIQKQDPTLAEVLKTVGYATGQFGKNHLGDRDSHLPTNHGFDEFFGNLYHLNAEEEPEGYFYPKDPKFKEKYGPRGVIHSWANGGKPKIEDTGPLNIKRMPTIDEEFLLETQRFIETSVNDKTPFFVWFNTTRMHVFTHLKKESLGKTGKGIEAEDAAALRELIRWVRGLGLAGRATATGMAKRCWNCSAWTWHRATAKASAASEGSGISDIWSADRTISCSWRLSAWP